MIGVRYASPLIETLARFACHTEGLLGPFVFRREVGRHCDNLGALSNPRAYGHADTRSERHATLWAPARGLCRVRPLSGDSSVLRSVSRAADDRIVIGIDRGEPRNPFSHG